MMNISYNLNLLMVNKKTVEIAPSPAKIEKIAIANGLILCLVSRLCDVYQMDLNKQCRNIFAINLNGEIVWKIQRSPDLNTDLNGKETANSFTNIWVEQDGVVKANIGHGLTYNVDILTGQLSGAEFIK